MATRRDMNDMEDWAKPGGRSAFYVAMVGTLSEGFRLVGPYATFDHAAAAHPDNQGDVWIMGMEAPPEGLSGLALERLSEPGEGGPPYDAATATGMYDPEGH